MPTITIRLKPDEMADLESAVQRSGKSLSDYVRETLELREQQPALLKEIERIDHNVASLVNTCQAIFRRLERLEELAGL